MTNPYLNLKKSTGETGANPYLTKTPTTPTTPEHPISTSSKFIGPVRPQESGGTEHEQRIAKMREFGDKSQSKFTKEIKSTLLGWERITHGLSTMFAKGMLDMSVTPAGAPKKGEEPKPLPEGVELKGTRIGGNLIFQRLQTTQERRDALSQEDKETINATLDSLKGQAKQYANDAQFFAEIGMGALAGAPLASNVAEQAAIKAGLPILKRLTIAGGANAIENTGIIAAQAFSEGRSPTSEELILSSVMGFAIPFAAGGTSAMSRSLAKWAEDMFKGGMDASIKGTKLDVENVFTKAGEKHGNYIKEIIEKEGVPKPKSPTEHAALSNVTDTMSRQLLGIDEGKINPKVVREAVDQALKRAGKDGVQVDSIKNAGEFLDSQVAKISKLEEGLDVKPTKGIDELLDEARNFKTADEFVEAKTTPFGGFRASVEDMIFDRLPDGTKFTRGEVTITKQGDKLFPTGKNVTKTLKNSNILLGKDGSIQIDALYSKASFVRDVGISVKSQLTDIFNKAKGEAQLIKKVTVKKVVKPKTEVKPKTVTVSREKVPIGKGEKRVSKLEARTKTKTQLKNLSEDNIEDLGLSTYNTMNKPDTIKRATEYVHKTPEDDLMAILRGEKLPPKDLNTNSIYVAMYNSAKGDMVLATKLASISSTAGGQNLSILTELSKNSPVRYLAKMSRDRVEALGGKERFRIVRKAETQAIKKSIKKATPDKHEWKSFIDEIMCK